MVSGILTCQPLIRTTCYLGGAQAYALSKTPESRADRNSPTQSGVPAYETESEKKQTEGALDP